MFLLRWAYSWRAMGAVTSSSFTTRQARQREREWGRSPGDRETPLLHTTWNNRSLPSFWDQFLLDLLADSRDALFTPLSVVFIQKFLVGNGKGLQYLLPSVSDRLVFNTPNCSLITIKQTLNNKCPYLSFCDWNSTTKADDSLAIGLVTADAIFS